MHINEFHTLDCPQFWSLPFLLSAHQLPEINMQILISTLLFYKKNNLFFTLWHLLCIICHFLSYTLHNTHHRPRLTHLSPLSLFSCRPRFSSIPPFSFWTLWGERWITRSRHKVTYKVTLSRLFNHMLQIWYATIHVIYHLLYLSAFRSRNPRRAHLSLLTHYISVAK